MFIFTIEFEFTFSCMHVNFFGYSMINNFHNDKSISSVNLYMCITYSEIAFHMFKIWAILKD